MRDHTRLTLPLLDTFLSLAVSFGNDPTWLIQLSFVATHVCLAMDTGPAPDLLQGIRLCNRFYRLYTYPLVEWSCRQTEATLAAAAQTLGLMYPVTS